MGKQLTVNGDAFMTNSLEVDDNLDINGQTRLNGYVRMPSINAYTGDVGDMEIVVIDPYGNVTRTSVSELISATMDPAFIDCGGTVESPHWFNGENKIYSPCPEVNVGIGNSLPEYKLDVSGTTFSLRLKVGNKEAVSTAMISAYTEEVGADLIQIGKKTGGAAAVVNFLINNEGAMIVSNTGGDATVTINNGTGHALIINDNSGTKILQLEDNGTLRSRHIIVSQDVWADYVFKEGYELMSLENTRKFIAEKGHLPNIPSEEEVKEEGLDIAEMQLLQMEKIEEMYLHMMEMNDQIKSLQSEVTTLRSENEQLKNK
jgi:hypothetical protein